MINIQKIIINKQKYTRKMCQTLQSSLLLDLQASSLKPLALPTLLLIGGCTETCANVKTVEKQRQILLELVGSVQLKTPRHEVQNSLNLSRKIVISWPIMHIFEKRFETDIRVATQIYKAVLSHLSLKRM